MDRPHLLQRRRWMRDFLPEFHRKDKSLLEAEERIHKLGEDPDSGIAITTYPQEGSVYSWLHEGADHKLTDSHPSGYRMLQVIEGGNEANVTRFFYADGGLVSVFRMPLTADEIERCDSSTEKFEDMLVAKAAALNRSGESTPSDEDRQELLERLQTAGGEAADV